MKLRKIKKKFQTCVEPYWKEFYNSEVSLGYCTNPKKSVSYIKHGRYYMHYNTPEPLSTNNLNSRKLTEIFKKIT